MEAGGGVYITGTELRQGGGLWGRNEGQGAVHDNGENRGRGHACFTHSGLWGGEGGKGARDKYRVSSLRWPEHKGEGSTTLTCNPPLPRPPPPTHTHLDPEPLRVEVVVVLIKSGLGEASERK